MPAITLQCSDRW